MPTSARDFTDFLRRNLGASFSLYARHGWPFTRVLLIPVLYQLLGGYGAVLFSYLAMGVFPVGIVGQLWLIPLLVLPVCLGMLAIFCRFFWKYLLYWVSLSRNAHDLLSRDPNVSQPDFQRAYTAATQRGAVYANYLLVLALLQLLPALPIGAILLLLTPLMIAQPAWGIFGLVVGTVLVLAISFVVLVVGVYLSLGIQVIALEQNQGVAAVLKRSISLVRGSFWRTAVLLVFWMVVTSMLAPGVIVGLLGLTPLMAGWQVLHEWMVSLVLQQLPLPGSGLFPDYDLFSNLLRTGLHDIAVSIAASVLSAVVTALLLPLGTFSFTCLYRDLATSRSAETSHPM